MPREALLVWVCAGLGEGNLGQTIIFLQCYPSHSCGPAWGGGFQFHTQVVRFSKWCPVYE